MKSLFFSFLLLLGGIWGWGQCPTLGIITFTSQTQIDNFAVNYPACTALGGYVAIGMVNENNNITNLNGLQQITTISGDLRIHNSLLINLHGLDSLNSVSGSFLISGNSALTSFQGLNALVSIGDHIAIAGNNVLTSLDGIESLTSIVSLSISGNPELQNLDALSSVNTIEGDITITANSKLTSLAGLSGISNFTGGLVVFHNDILSSLDGIPVQNSIGGSLLISNNDSLTSISALSQLTSIGRTLYLEENMVLTNLSGLNALTEVNEGIYIRGNDALTALDELNALTLVGTFIEIGNNSNLTNLDGLGNIDSIGGAISVYNNTQLSDCSVIAFCNKLANNPASVIIENNATGCNSNLEVLENCTPSFTTTQGTVYFDLNCNNQLDASDQASSQILLHDLPNNTPIASTDHNGEYISFLLPNTTIEYITQVPPGFTVQPISYTIITDSTIQLFPNKDFRLCPDSLFHNLKTTLTSVTIPRPGFTNQYQVCVQNLGTQPENAVLTLDFSIGPGAQYITITDAAGGSVQNNIITWNINDLQLFNSKCFTVTIQLATNTPLGIYLQPTSNVSLAPLQTETKYTDNSVELRDQVVGSFDPNDKTVDMPNITFDPTSGVTRLQYKIRFQNTGTFPATFIEVLDTLESKLDIRTLEMVAASHDYTLSFPSPNVLKWRFDDINLPDSTSNEAGSHGFIVFNISTITPINLGEVVQNRAGIYFDFNEPVITNYAWTFFTVGVHDPFGLGSLPLSIAPNPTQDNITLRYTLTESADSELIITNAQGVVVQSQRLGRQGLGDYALPVDLAGLPAGLYLVTVRAGGRVGVGKLVRL